MEPPDPSAENGSGYTMEDAGSPYLSGDFNEGTFNLDSDNRLIDDEPINTYEPVEQVEPLHTHARYYAKGDSARIKLVLEEDVYFGLTRSELIHYKNDPFWIRLRIFFYILMFIGWGILLGGALYAIQILPKCPYRPPSTSFWPEKSIVYQINVPSFKVGHTCGERRSGTVQGIHDILIMPNPDHEFSKNYFLNHLKYINTFWLRGIHATYTEDFNAIGGLDANIVGTNMKYMSDLYMKTRREKKFVLIDLLPYLIKSTIVTNSSAADCSFLNGVSETVSPFYKRFQCFPHDDLELLLIRFIEHHAAHVNGFVLDYAPWLLQTKKGFEALQRIVDTVNKFDETTVVKLYKDFSKKYVFMRMPMISADYMEPAKLHKRLAEEAIAKKAGVRAIVETIDMISDNSCLHSRCLASIVTNFQQSYEIDPQYLKDNENAGNITFLSPDDLPHRMFTIDDPVLSQRALPKQPASIDGNRTWSSESLSAFMVAALPGSPVIYYGSEIGMSHESPLTQMRWSDDDDEPNRCKVPHDEPYCFCSLFCDFNKNSPKGCPPSHPVLFPLYKGYKSGDDDFYPPVVDTQVRSEGGGPLVFFKKALEAKWKKDSVLWGVSNVTMLSAPKNDRYPPLFILRHANDDFNDVALVIGFDDKDGFPNDKRNGDCVKTLAYHSDNQGKEKLITNHVSQIVVAPHEVRLIEIFQCGKNQASSSYSTPSFFTLLVLLVLSSLF